MTFYLKYRPQTIDELDLEKVRTQLTQALKAKSVPHAFMFSGSRGLGKTSSARIVAKAINCQTSPAKRKDGIEPCNDCDACNSITSGFSADVIEIDGASNRGIDDIRALRETVSLAPLQLSKKVYIIDEVHMLTKEAFNALLKTLEEPPGHVVFILATTEPHKVPETILSRSFHVQFQRADDAEIIRSLERVVKGEKLTVDKQVLDAIVKRSGGGFRDSVKLLEQLSFGTQRITIDDFNRTFGDDRTEDFVDKLLKRDGSGALLWIKAQEQSGADWLEINRNILTLLRQRLVDAVVNNTNKDRLINQNELVDLITLCMHYSSMLRSALVETLPLELVVAKWCISGSSGPSVKAENTNRTNTDLSKAAETVNKASVSKPAAEKPALPKHATKEEQASDNSEIEVTATPSLDTGSHITFTLDEIRQQWEEILLKIRPQNRSLESILRGAVLSEIDGDNLVITVYYGLHKQQLESDKYLRIVESGIKDLFACKPRLQYVLGDKKEKAVHEAVKDQELEKNVEEIFS